MPCPRPGGIRGSMALYQCYKTRALCVLWIVSWHGHVVTAWTRSKMAHIEGRSNHRAWHGFGHIWQDGQSVVTLLGEHKDLTSTAMLAGTYFIMAQLFSPACVSVVCKGSPHLGNIGWGGRFVL